MSKDTQTHLLSVPVIIGTSGHIDHGKSSLIKALTGTDTDRLIEEKRRGITIELGYAFLDDSIAFIDVPGHEKFIRQMVAGATTVDYSMLVVAADDGVMPQTREHLDILNLLDVKGGIIVITKADLVDSELIQLVKEDILQTVSNSVLKDAPILVVDSVSGRGIEKVRRSIYDIAAQKRIQRGSSVLKIPIDRVFSLKGFGTVVTGSIISGKVSSGQQVELLPQQRKLRVKALQSQGQLVEHAVAGRRIAVNLANISVAEIARGNTLSMPDSLTPTNFIHARIEVLSSSPIPIKHGQRIHLHIGTADLIARVLLLEDHSIEPSTQGYAQIKLESLTVCQRLERFIIRRYSPLITIGGGVVLDGNPKRERVKRSKLRNALVRLDTTEMKDLVLTLLERSPFSTADEIAATISCTSKEAEQTILDLLHSGELYSIEVKNGEKVCSVSYFQKVLGGIREVLRAFHSANPLKAGIGQSELISKIAHLLPKEVSKGCIGMAVEQGHLSIKSPTLISLPEFSPRLSEQQEDNIDRLLHRIEDAEMTPPSLEEVAAALSTTVVETKNLLDYLVDSQKLVCLEGNLYFSTRNIHEARKVLVDLFKDKEMLTVSEIRQSLRSTRKYIIPLLVYFDSIGWTKRRNELRLAGNNLIPTK